MTGTAMECIAWLSTQKDGMFDVEIHKEKRSLNANALYHKMVNQIAKALKMAVVVWCISQALTTNGLSTLLKVKTRYYKNIIQ